MNFRLVLYEALASANVPSDQARAVVEALEHEMYTVLATKTDLAASMELFKEQLARYSAEIRQEMAEQNGLMRKEFYQQLAENRSDLGGQLASSTAGLRSGLTGQIASSAAELRAELGDQIASSAVGLRAELGDQIASSAAGLRAELGDQIASSAAGLRAELHEQMATMATREMVKGLVTQEQFDFAIAALRKDMELLRASMTIRLGSMQAVGLGVLFAALKLT